MAWIEVRGIEPGEQLTELLHKFPEAQWTEEFAQEIKASLSGHGVTRIEILQVDEE